MNCSTRSLNGLILNLENDLVHRSMLLAMLTAKTVKESNKTEAMRRSCLSTGDTMFLQELMQRTVETQKDGRIGLSHRKLLKKGLPDFKVMTEDELDLCSLLLHRPIYKIKQHGYLPYDKNK